MDLRQFAGRFQEVHWLGDQKFKSRCPCPTHHDGDPELSLIAREANGRILIACFADLGDTTDSILSSIGLTASDLRVVVPEAETPAGAFSSNGTSSYPNGSRGSYALAYAKYGIPVFPVHTRDPDGECSCGKLQCKSLGKHPRHKDWQAEATTDPQKIRNLWSEYPSANIGVACGKTAGLTILDVDGDEGRESLRALEQEHGELAQTPLVITGSGGNHYYFQYEPEVIGRTRIAAGLDFRTEGNLVVGVGSRNANGEYLWEVGYSLKDLPRSKMPEWLKKLGQKSTRELVKRDESQPPLPIAQAAQMLQHIDADDRNTWLQVGMALKAEYGVHGRALWDTYSKRSTNKFDPEDQNKTWASIDVEGGIGIGTVVKLAKEAGWHPASPTVLTVDPILKEIDRALTTMVDRNSIEFRSAHIYLDNIRQFRGQQKVFTEGLTRSHSLAMLVGRAWHGKSTIAANLARARCLGEGFLGHQCYPCRVGYMALERNSEDIVGLFERWGVADQIQVVDSVPLGDPREVASALAHAIRRHELEVVTVDHLIGMIRMADGNDYVGVSQALQPFNTVSKITGACIELLHHKPKALATGTEINVMGSEAFRAATDTLMEASKIGNNYFFRAQLRGSPDIERMRVTLTDEGLLSGEDSVEGVKAEVLEALQGLDKEISKAALVEKYPELAVFHPKTILKALHALREAGLIERQKRRGTYQYWVAENGNQGSLDLNEKKFEEN